MGELGGAEERENGGKKGKATKKEKEREDRKRKRAESEASEKQKKRNKLVDVRCSTPQPPIPSILLSSLSIRTNAEGCWPRPAMQRITA